MKPKYEISWRKRKNAAESKSALLTEEVPWHKRAVTWVQAVAVATVTFLAWVLLNGVAAMQNAEQFPDIFAKTRDSLLSRYYDDSSWTGVWSNSPEGYADSSDVTLSDVDVYLQLQTAQGTVDGTIATRKLCRQLPFAVDGVLFRGEVSGKVIHGMAFDYIGGKQVKLASVSIQRDAIDASVLTVYVTEDGLESFPLKARIRRDFNKKPMDIQADDGTYCEAELYLDGRTVSKKRKPVTELQRSLLPAQ